MEYSIEDVAGSDTKKKKRKRRLKKLGEALVGVTKELKRTPQKVEPENKRLEKNEGIRKKKEGQTKRGWRGAVFLSTIRVRGVKRDETRVGTRGAPGKGIPFESSTEGFLQKKKNSQKGRKSNSIGGTIRGNEEGEIGKRMT